MDRFRTAVEARDLAAIEALLDEHVVFHSPVVFKPYEGRAATLLVLRHVIDVFQDLRYVRELQETTPGPAGRTGSALMFEARVQGLQITGCDFLRYDAGGQVAELMVMTRPLKATLALAQTMATRLGA